MLSVNFNGHELNKYIGVLSGFTLLKGAEFLLDLQDIDGGNGSRVFNTHYGPKTIPMPFMARNDLINKYDELQRILKVDEPKPLIFGNAPDRIYYAMPVGDMDMDEFLNFGKGTITWLVPDGLAHATTETPFPATLNSDGVLEATIVNDGTAEVPISYEIKHKSDNGYVGIVSEYGVMEFGSRDELDGENYQANEQVFSTDTFSDWTPDTGLNSQNINFATNGTLSLQSYEGRTGIGLSDAGSGDYWHGGQWARTIPDPTTSFYSYFNANFQTGLIPQTGLFVLSFLDEDGKNLCSYTITKHATNSNWADVQFYVGNKLYEKIGFFPTYKNEDNQFAFVSGHCSVSKVGDLFSFYWRGYGGHEWHVPELKDKKCAKIQIYLAQIGNRTLSENDYLTRNFLRNMSFVKVNVDKWRDVPNRYSNELLLRIDGEEKKPYTNGMLALDDEIVGTQYFLAPPGETKVKFYVSSFAEPPEIKAIIRKAWL